MPDLFDPFALFLRFLGAFYVFAGIVAGRAALMSALLDAALSGISLKPVSFRERALSLWLLASSWLVFSSGVLLMALAREAMWAFMLCALTQGFYLTFAAPYYFDVDDPPDPNGRRQTTNAFFIYSAATFLVIWASGAYLTPVSSLHPALAVIVWTVLGAFAAFAIWQSVAAGRLPRLDALAPSEDEATGHENPQGGVRRFDPRRQRVELRLVDDVAEIRDQKTGAAIPVDTLPLSEDLRGDLESWLKNGDPEKLGLAYDLSLRLAQECTDLAVAEPGIPLSYFGWSIASPFAEPADGPPDWDRMKSVKIMTDYGCMPVWAADAGAFGDMPPNALGVSSELEDALLDWQDAFDESLNDEDPANPHWTKDQFETHLEQGLTLALRVKAERPDLTVYAHTMRGTLVVDPNISPGQWRAKEP